MEVKKSTLVVLSLRPVFWMLKVSFPVWVEDSFFKNIIAATVSSVLDDDDCAYYCNAVLDQSLREMEMLGVSDTFSYELLRMTYAQVSNIISEFLPNFDFDGSTGLFDFTVRNDFDLIIAFYPPLPAVRNL